MEKGIQKNKIFIISGIMLLVVGLLFPFVTETAWFNILFKIRQAINSGDSGHLILASASMSFLYAIHSTFLFLGVIFIIYSFNFGAFTYKNSKSILTLIFVIGVHIISANISGLSWEPVSTTLALIMSLIIFEKLFWKTNNYLHVTAVLIQVFFAFQWLNIMPIFSSYLVGQSDIYSSIKISGLYLKAPSVLNFTGFAFFSPFMFSAFATTTLFISYSQNINIMRENYEKEKEIQIMKANVLENRIYKEVKSLVHDLKTPLVTIRGLNSLLALSKDTEKLDEYTDRIDNSIHKMSEMISNFLYETSRQNLEAVELIDYIRAQLPLDDDTIKIEIEIASKLPRIRINKIIVSRAVINVLENAIIVPCNDTQKQIRFEVKCDSNGLYIIIQDNGIGIKEADLQRIWEVGYSTNNTSGLGLPFAKQIIEENEGSIDIKSKLGRGTVVTIFIPSINTESNNIY